MTKDMTDYNCYQRTYIVEIGPWRLTTGSIRWVRFWSRVARRLGMPLTYLPFEEWMHARVDDIRAVAERSSASAGAEQALAEEVRR